MTTLRNRALSTLIAAFAAGPSVAAQFERCELKVEVKSTNSHILYVNGRALYSKPITILVKEAKTLEGHMVGCEGKFLNQEIRVDVLAEKKDGNRLVAALASLKAGSPATLGYEVGMGELAVEGNPQTTLYADWWLKSTP